MIAGDAGPAQDNPQGHWESRSLTEFNDILLDRLGGSWMAPPEPMPASELQARLRSHRTDAAERFRRVYKEPGWLWKDPRLCLLLPFWLDVLDVEPIVVLTVRAPESAAASLMRRNGLGKAHALALWERYESAALLHSAKLRTAVVRYDRLVDNPAAEVRKLRRTLDRHGAALHTAEGGVDEAIAVVDSKLRRHQQPPATPSAERVADKTSRDHVAHLLAQLGEDYERFPRVETPSMDTASRELLAARRQLRQARKAAEQTAGRARELEGKLESRRAVVQENRKLPTVPCTSREHFQGVHESEPFADRYKLEVLIARRYQDRERFSLPGTCLLCERPVEFELDWQYSHPAVDASWLSGDGSPLEVKIPNWRERMLCPGCRMNNRQRAIAAEIRRAIRHQGERLGRAPKLYFTEQITPMFEYFSTKVPGAECLGSEFLGPDVAGGSVHDGLRHENVESLSFGDAAFDLAISCSVLEHVSEPLAALHELTRVLGPGGELYLEVPFNIHMDRNVRRARWRNGEVEHLLPPEYHGDPLSEAGALVYSDFGWEFFDQMCELDEMEWRLLVYWSLELGHLGGTQFFFHGRRR